MTNPDYRALCAELLEWAERTSSHYVVHPDVILRARAALTEDPVGPTDEELWEAWGCFEPEPPWLRIRWGQP